MSFEKSLERKPRKIADRARAVAEDVRAGATAAQLGARRLRHDRHVLSVRLGRSWRVMLEERDGRLVPVALMSHEQYSTGKKLGRR